MRRAERAKFKLDRAKAIAAAAAEAEAAFATEGRVIASEELKASIPSAATWRPAASTSEPQPSETRPIEDEQGAELEDEQLLEDLEHLQLTFQEAFLLAWTMDCLTILDPETDKAIPLQDLWQQFQLSHHPLAFSPSSIQEHLRPDNPFIINYVVYHHYRSLGWVIKTGIKFCVDYLLYKRGPVFSHAEFAVVVIPVYEEPADAEESPYNLSNVEPFSWSWLSTINRVNSQVHKTLILSYVTIPARDQIADQMNTPACLARYSVREVTVRRFIPARMRD